MPVGRVVVVGSVNVDRTLSCPHLPAPGETVLAEAAVVGFGGKGGNQAVAAARTAPTALVAAVGDDQAGRDALADLSAAGVDVTEVRALARTPTGQATVLVDAHGENAIVVLGGANAALAGPDVATALGRLDLQSTDVVLSSAEVPGTCAAATARACAASGATWVHNLAPYRAPEPWWRELPPHLVLNRVEAEQATGEPDPERAAIALARHLPWVVVTLGPRGALLARAGHVAAFAAPAVAVVDSTGAGDAFCGALVAALAGGAALPGAVTAAVATGALAVTTPGARLPTPERADQRWSGRPRL